MLRPKVRGVCDPLPTEAAVGLCPGSEHSTADVIMLRFLKNFLSFDNKISQIQTSNLLLKDDYMKGVKLINHGQGHLGVIAIRIGDPNST